MDKAGLLARIAPCSLLCHTCGAYADSVMAELSRELLHYTQGVAGCGLRDCTRAHDVDFCGQCAEFPCEKPFGSEQEQVVLSFRYA
ncbi:MAG: DUF3795 domain-containing protein [Candidatus Spyradocola sp.]